MGSERAAFLAAILRDPDDDTNRTVFADWLDEHGDPDRAEFIRAQCTLSPWEQVPGDSFTVIGPNSTVLDFCPGGVNLGQLRRREKDLIHRHGYDWAAEDLPAFARPVLGPDVAQAFRRGFADRAVLTWWQWAKRGDELLGLAAVKRVALPDRPRIHVSEYGAASPFRRYRLRPDNRAADFCESEVIAEVNRESVMNLGPDAPYPIERAVCRLRWPGIEFEVLGPDQASCFEVTRPSDNRIPVRGAWLRRFLVGPCGGPEAALDHPGVPREWDGLPGDPVYQVEERHARYIGGGTWSVVIIYRSPAFEAGVRTAAALNEDFWRTFLAAQLPPPNPDDFRAPRTAGPDATTPTPEKP